MEKNSGMLAQMAKGASITFIFGILGYLFIFLFKLIAARYFGPADFGLYSLAETILGIAVLFITLGIPQGITRYIPYYTAKGDIKSLSGYFNFIFRYPFIFSIITAVFLFFFSSQLTQFFGFPSVFTTILKILAFVLPFRIINNVLRKIFVAKKKVIYREIAYNVFENGFMLLSIVLIAFFNFSIIYLIVALVGSVLVSALYCIYQYRKSIRIELSSAKTFKTKSWLLFSVPLFFSGVFSYFIGWSDNLAISRYMEPVHLGIYAVAYSLANFLMFFLNSFSPIFIPLISESSASGKKSELTFLFRKSAAWSFGLTFPVFLVLITYSRTILSILYGPEYVAGTLALIILSTGTLVAMSLGLNNCVLILHKKTFFIFWTSSAMAFFNIAMNVALIPIYGIIGAAIATSSTLVVNNLIRHIVARRYENLSFDWIYVLKFLAAGVLAIFLATRLSVLNMPQTIALVVEAIVYIILYLLFLLLLKTFRKEDFEILSAVEKKLGLNLGFLRRFIRKFY